MKKNVLALSIAAMIGGLGFAGAASAEVVAGTATFAPGVTMTATDATVLQISDAGTGHNLHDILDFQVFLSPGDVWTAAVTEGADGVAQIVTNDNTCTVPTLTAGVPQSFVKNRLNSRLSNADQANHTREGYVEIFNMADIPPVTASTAVTAANSLYLATKHANAVAPCSVAGSPARTLLDTIATTNYANEVDASAAGFNTPSTGLMGDWYIINVPQTTTFSGAATSVTARVAVNGAAGRGNFVHFPQTEVPVAAAAVLNFTADPLFRTDARAATAGNGGDYAAATVGTAAIAAASYDLPDMSTPYTTTANGVVDAQSPLVQAGLLTSALAVTSVANQYATDPTISAKTD
ncbi:MAG: cell surface protein, partial [Hyphomicrobiales bacterium]